MEGTERNKNVKLGGEGLWLEGVVLNKKDIYTKEPWEEGGDSLFNL